jgi:hypothetical protein
MYGHYARPQPKVESPGHRRASIATHLWARPTTLSVLNGTY